MTSTMGMIHRPMSLELYLLRTSMPTKMIASPAIPSTERSISPRMSDWWRPIARMTGMPGQAEDDLDVGPLEVLAARANREDGDDDRKDHDLPADPGPARPLPRGPQRGDQQGGGLDRGRCLLVRCHGSAWSSPVEMDGRSEPAAVPQLPIPLRGIATDPAVREPPRPTWRRSR